MPRLILVDGFAGTGKSTTAQRLWLDLARAGTRACWFHEHERAHPIFQYGEVDELLHLTPAHLERQLLTAWKTLAAQSGGPEIQIIEGAFFQIPIGVMLAIGAPVVQIRALVRQIDAVLTEQDVSFVYLFRPDLRKALQRIGDLRGPHWMTAMTAALAESPYGRRHHVKNLGGLVTFYERQRAIVESVMPRLTLKQTSVDVSRGRSASRDRQLADFVAIRPTMEPSLRRDVLWQHAGAYRSEAGLPGVMTTDGHRLYLQLPATRALPLVRVRAGHFVAESLPIDIRVAYDTRGRARRFRYESRMSNEVLTDTVWVRE